MVRQINVLCKTLMQMPKKLKTGFHLFSRKWVLNETHSLPGSLFFPINLAVLSYSTTVDTPKYIQQNIKTISNILVWKF